MPKRPGPQLDATNRRKLVAAREKRGLTQGQLAELVGCDRVTVAFIESGKRNPGWETLTKLAAALGLRASVRLTRA
jgi:DNA-binding XRE family transcriptional regulator